MASPVFQLHLGVTVCEVASPALQLRPGASNDVPLLELLQEVRSGALQRLSCVFQRAGERSAQWRLHCSVSHWRQVLSVVSFLEGS